MESGHQPVVILTFRAAAIKKDMLLQGLNRLMELPKDLRTEVMLGYRRKDEHLVLVVEAGQQKSDFGALISNVLQQPGSELCELQPSVLSPVEILAAKQKALSTCDASVVVTYPLQAISKMRSLIEAKRERQSLARIPTNQTVSYRILGNGTGVTRGVNNDELVIETNNKLPPVGCEILLEYTVGDAMPTRGIVQVIRQNELQKSFVCKIPQSAEQSGDDVAEDKRALRIRFQTIEEVAREYRNNISYGGLFVPTEQALKVSESATLLLTLPDGERIRLASQVVYIVTPEQAQTNQSLPGCGLQFQLPPSAKEIFQKYLDRAPAPQVISAIAQTDKVPQLSEITESMPGTGEDPSEITEPTPKVETTPSEPLLKASLEFYASSPNEEQVETERERLRVKTMSSQSQMPAVRINTHEPAPIPVDAPIMMVTPTNTFSVPPAPELSSIEAAPTCAVPSFPPPAPTPIDFVQSLPETSSPKLVPDDFCEEASLFDQMLPFDHTLSAAPQPTSADIELEELEAQLNSIAAQLVSHESASKLGTSEPVLHASEQWEHLAIPQTAPFAPQDQAIVRAAGSSRAPIEPFAITDALPNAEKASTYQMEAPSANPSSDVEPPKTADYFSATKVPRAFNQRQTGDLPKLPSLFTQKTTESTPPPPLNPPTSAPPPLPPQLNAKPRTQNPVSKAPKMRPLTGGLPPLPQIMPLKQEMDVNKTTIVLLAPREPFWRAFKRQLTSKGIEVLQIESVDQWISSLRSNLIVCDPVLKESFDKHKKLPEEAQIIVVEELQGVFSKSQGVQSICDRIIAMESKRK